jgi:uncharacterized membrane protein YhaH (DUF805 family)
MNTITTNRELVINEVPYPPNSVWDRVGSYYHHRGSQAVVNFSTEDLANHELFTVKYPGLNRWMFVALTFMVHVTYNLLLKVAHKVAAGFEMAGWGSIEGELVMLLFLALIMFLFYLSVQRAYNLGVNAWWALLGLLPIVCILGWILPPGFNQNGRRLDTAAWFTIGFIATFVAIGLIAIRSQQLI